MALLNHPPGPERSVCFSEEHGIEILIAPAFYNGFWAIPVEAKHKALSRHGSPCSANILLRLVGLGGGTGGILVGTGASEVVRGAAGAGAGVGVGTGAGAAAEAGGAGWSRIAGGLSWFRIETTGKEPWRDWSSTISETVRGGGLAMGGAEEEDDDDNEEEEEDEDEAWPDSVEDISHFGGSMACFGGGCGSFDSGAGVKRTSTEPGTELMHKHTNMYTDRHMDR